MQTLIEGPHFSAVVHGHVEIKQNITGGMLIKFGGILVDGFLAGGNILNIEDPQARVNLPAGLERVR